MTQAAQIVSLADNIYKDILIRYQHQNVSIKYINMRGKIHSMRVIQVILAASDAKFTPMAQAPDPSSGKRAFAGLEEAAGPSSYRS